MDSQLTMERQFQARDEFDQAMYLLDCNEREKRFLHLLYDLTADESLRMQMNTRDLACEIRRDRNTLWVVCDQQKMAEHLGYKDARTIREICATLASYDPDERLFRKIKITHRKTQRTCYVVNLRELDRRTQLDPEGVIYQVIDTLGGDPFGEGSAGGHPELSTTSSSSSGGSSGPSSGGSSAPLGLGLVPGHVSTTNSNPPVSPCHGHGEEQGISKICYSESVWRDLTDDDVRRLASSLDMKTLKELNRVGIDQWKWADDPAFFQKFIAMVLHCGTSKGIESPKNALKGLMKKKAWAKIPTWAEDQASEFLKKHKPPPAPIVLNGFGGMPREHPPDKEDVLRQLAGYSQ